MVVFPRICSFRVKMLASLPWLVLISLLLLTAPTSEVAAETVAVCGKGWLEKIDGTLVLHVKGTPYEMGYQHGALLKEHCQQNFHHLLGKDGGDVFEVEGVKINPRVAIDAIVKMQEPHIPAKYFEELKGLAEAAELDLKDVRAANFIPEMFHCSGFAVMNSATADGTLYHGRVLDYACDWRLQEHAVIMVAEPDGEIPFVNITYAGFVGSVTGMNIKQVSIGEMGGPGFGHWNGMPMALLMREVLQTSADLEHALAVFQENPRTCVYYYVIADGKTNRAVGVATNWEKVVTIKPGEFHKLLPSPVQDSVLLSAGKRYELLVERVQDQHGKIDAEKARHLMDRPVAMNSNLHNVLFAPASTKFWVAQASVDRKPAAEQPYQAFQLSELLTRQPDPAAKSIPMQVAAADKAVTASN